MKIMNSAKKYGAPVVGVVALGASNFAMAAVDTAELVTSIEGNEAGMTSVGMAMLGLVVVVVLFTMVRRVLK